MRPVVHARGVVPEKERLARLDRAIHEIERVGEQFAFHRFHAFPAERTGVRAYLLAHPAKARIFCPVVFVARLAVEHAARAEPRGEFRILWIVFILRFFFRVQVIEVSKKLVEPVNRRQELIPVAQVVLANLGRRITFGLEQFSQGGVFGLQPEIRARYTDFCEACTNRALAGDEG